MSDSVAPAVLGAILGVLVLTSLVLGKLLYSQHQLAVAQQLDYKLLPEPLTAFAHRVRQIITCHSSKPGDAAASNASIEAQTGQWRIDYTELQLQESMASGQCGTVYKARWRGLTVAAKELSLQSKASERELDDFALTKHFELVRRLRHPNLVLFLGISQNNNASATTIKNDTAVKQAPKMPTSPSSAGAKASNSQQLYIINEYMDKRNLYHVLHNNTIHLTFTKRITLALDVARALNYLHLLKPQPLVHKAVNSLNILVDENLTAKVSDYALDSIRALAVKTQHYTQPLWDAPELLKQKQPRHTVKTDVYGFGIVLCELLTRKTPYAGKISATTAVSAVKDIIQGMRPEIPPRTPERLQQLITNCWNGDPLLRPSMSDVVAELQAIEKLKIEMRDIMEGGTMNGEGRVQSADAGKQLDPQALQQLWQSEITQLGANVGAAPTSSNKPWVVGAEEFTIGKIAGSGSFGTVYDGQFRGKKVAIKKLVVASKERLVAANSIRDMVRELNFMCNLRHSNIVLFMAANFNIDMKRHTPILHIVMEWCEKHDLRATLANAKIPIDYNLIIKILLGVTDGLTYLHTMKPAPIVHRDLKSANILLDEHYNAKISDFGLTDAIRSGDVTAAVGGEASKLNVGTTYWQAPETLEKNVTSPASDIYSLGMIVWELFTREVPFSGLNPHQAAMAVASEDKRPDIPVYVPPRFRNLISACWQRDPAKRPPIAEIKKELLILQSEGLPRVELTTHSRARLYRKKLAVFAYRSKDAVIVYKPWGTGEGKKNDWVIVGPGDDIYTCDAAIFNTTYAPVLDKDGRPTNMFRKTGQIWALEMEDDFLLETLEGMEHGKKGDFIAQNPVEREQWPIAGNTFRAMYEEDPLQVVEAKQKRVTAQPTVG